MSSLLNRERAARVLREAGADILVGTTSNNVTYLSGYQPFGQRFLPTTQVYAVVQADALDQATVVAPIADTDMAVQFPTPDAHMRWYGRFFVETPPTEDGLSEEMRRFAAFNAAQPPASALAVLLDVLRACPAQARIAVDERGIAPANYAALAEEFGARLMPGADLLDRIRMVKTPEEIRRLRRAVEVIEASYRAALEAAHEGMTEHEMATVFDTTTVQLGCAPVFTVIAFGERSAFPNAVPSDARLRPGDIIRFDIGCRAEGYNSDISRTAIFGQPSPKQHAYYQAILDGEEAGLAALRPGARACDIFATAVTATQKGGIPHYRRQHVGHGIGLDVYDHPVLNESTQTPLEPGMVFEVETPYYEIGFGGIQVEDTAVITESGYELLTRTPRTLRSVG